MRSALMLILITGLVLGGVTAGQAQNFRAGEHFTVLDQPQPTSTEDGRVEVLEFFSYACPACFDFHPMERSWTESHADRIDFQAVPVTFNRDSWEVVARAFYVSETLDALDITHDAMYNAIHVEGRSFNSVNDVADFYAELGLDREAVVSAYDSFAVEMKMRRAERLTRAYAVPGTPTMGVAGRYMIDVRSAGGQQGMLRVASHLVERER